MTTPEDFTKRQNIPTVPDAVEISRVGRVSETVKDVLVWELRNYFNTTRTARADATPSVEKFSAYLPGNTREQDPYETAVRILRMWPDITQDMPFIGIGTHTIKNNKMALSGKFVDSIKPRPSLIAGTGTFGPPGVITPIAASPASWPDGNQPSPPPDSHNPTGLPIYGLVAGDTLQITTIIDGVTNVSNFIFPQDLLGVAPQTPRMIADIINIQALYCRASVVFINSLPTLIITVGGPLGNGINYSIQRTAASANFDAFVNLPTTAAIAPSDAFPAVNRYMISYNMDVALTVMTEDENTRTELTDIIMDYFSFVMDDRGFTYYGRSFFGNQSDESYQIIIKDNDIVVADEEEVPRQDDPTRKIYMNTCTVPVTAIQYIDRTVAMGVAAARLTTLPIPV